LTEDVEAAAREADTPGNRPDMLYPRAFYLLYYAATAALQPFLILYYREIELTGSQIGFLAGLMPLTTLLAAPLWGEVADSIGRPRALLLASIVASFVPVVVISLSTGFSTVLLGVFLFALLLAPVMPLADNAVLEALGDRQHEYGRQRLWGAVGWGVAALLVGFLTERASIHFAFYGYLALMACGFIVALRLPVASAGPRRILGRGLGSLLSDWRWLAFLFGAFLGGAALAVNSSFLFLYMADMGSSRTLIGLALLVATISELPVFLHAGGLLRRTGAAALMSVSLLVYVGRMVAYSFVAAPGWILPLQLLHGASYATMWVAGVSLAKQLAPEGSGNAAQGLFAATVLGLGGSIGGFAGGILYETLGGPAMFRWVAGGLLAGLLVLSMSTTSPRPPRVRR
jgi:PPP family 3-phenylpropionic acid transporter